MGHFKALTLAGALLLATAGAAFAADLLPPPPAPEPVMADPEFSGWYIRGDVGVGITSSSKLKSSFNDAGFDSVFNDVQTDKTTLGDSVFLRAGVGYQFNNWLRADLTGEYRTGVAINAIESYKNIAYPLIPGQPDSGTTGNVFGSCGLVPNLTNSVANGAQGRCYDKYSSSVRSIVVMANGYVDLGTWYNLTPYVGAGVGLSNNRWSTVTDQAGNNTGFGYSAEKSKTSLAWALMTGVSYAVTPNLKLELGYRYLNMGDITSAPITCSNLAGCHFEVQKLTLASQDLHIGMRWLIGANAHGNGQALYWGEGGAAAGSLAQGAGYAGGGTAYAGGGAYTGGAVQRGGPVVRRY